MGKVSIKEMVRRALDNLGMKAGNDAIKNYIANNYSRGGIKDVTIKNIRHAYSKEKEGEQSQSPTVTTAVSNPTAKSSGATRKKTARKSAGKPTTASAKDSEPLTLTDKMAKLSHIRDHLMSLAFAEKELEEEIRNDFDQLTADLVEAKIIKPVQLQHVPAQGEPEPGFFRRIEHEAKSGDEFDPTAQG